MFIFFYEPNQNYEHNIPHYAYKTDVWCPLFGDTDKVKVTVTCSHYTIRQAEVGLLKIAEIDRSWSVNQISYNK